MEYIYPDYYDKFECIGSKCEDNCCMAGWQIAVDEESQEMYKTMEGTIGNRIRNSIDWEKGMFDQCAHKCALLNEDNLCDIYCEAGPEKMCNLCREYPRHYEEYENIREVSLSVSCPEACRIVLSHRGEVKYYSVDKEGDEEYEDFDYLMHTKLLEIRDFLYEILWNDSLPLKYRMALMLTTVHDIQNRVDRDEIFEIDELLDKYREEDFTKKAVKKFGAYVDKPLEKKSYISDMCSRLHKLEVLRPSWTEFVEECEKILYLEADVSGYSAISRDYFKSYTCAEAEYEQLLAYFIYTYFCGSVYDYDLFSKVKFSIYCVMMIEELDKACWYKKGRHFEFEDQVNITHLFSMEVEHSDLNLNDAEKMMKRDKVFGYKKMLTALLG